MNAMEQPATFNEEDWRRLTAHDKRSLRLFSSRSLGFEPLANLTGVGQKSMDALMAKGLAVEGEPGTYGRTFKITNKGWLAVDWLNGRRTPVYPSD